MEATAYCGECNKITKITSLSISINSAVVATLECKHEFIIGWAKLIKEERNAT